MPSANAKILWPPPFPLLKPVQRGCGDLHIKLNETMDHSKW